jgi:hypothetical protein
MTPRDTDVETLALVIAELVDRYETSERHTWRPTREAPGYDRKVPGRDGKPRWEKPLPRTAQRRVHHPRTGPAQAAAPRPRKAPGHHEAARVRLRPRPGLPPDRRRGPSRGRHGPHPGPRDVRGGHTKPSSTPPAGLDAIETLIDITVAIAHTRGQLRVACGRGRVEPAPVMLRDLAYLVVRKDGEGQWLVPDRQVRRLLGEAPSWASTARLALRYDAPVVVLKDRHCADGPGGQPEVCVDPSSDVWCAGIPGRLLKGRRSRVSRGRSRTAVAGRGGHG